MPIMHSSILKSLVELRSKSMLMWSSLVEFPLFTVCPCINKKLLEQLYIYDDDDDDDDDDNNMFFQELLFKQGLYL